MPTSKPAQAGSVASPILPPLELAPESNQPLALAPEPGLEVTRLRGAIDMQMQAAEHRMQLAQAGEMAKFHEAFARAQSQFGPILRDKQVKVWSQRTQKEYTFMFAPLPNILAATMPALTAEGFSVWQEVVVDRSPGAVGWAVITHLEHAFGTRVNTMPVFVGDTTSAAFASACSYARRYGFTLLMNVTGDDDEDGSLGRGDHFEYDQRPNNVGAARTGSRGKDPAPPPGGAPGRATPQSTRAAPAPAPKPERVPTYLETIETVEAVEPPADDAELEKAEGLIVDATQELIEAAQDGRAHGIEQIWNEIRSQQYVAVMVWRKLKADAPDAFSTVKATLEKAEKASKANAAPVKRGDRG